MPDDIQTELHEVKAALRLPLVTAQHDGQHTLRVSHRDGRTDHVTCERSGEQWLWRWGSTGHAVTGAGASPAAVARMIVIQIKPGVYGAWE